jgi:hypothetical protein
MDELLKLAGDAGHEVSLAEAALEEEAFENAREALDRGRELLAQLRQRWPQMSATERAIVGPAATAVRGRLDEIAARVPVRRALSNGAPVVDPEQEAAPEEVTPEAPGLPEAPGSPGSPAG